MAPQTLTSPREITIVAHRAGNSAVVAKEALGRCDLIEVDVHVFRGRIEVRHEKVLWPSSRLWERWYLFPRNTPRVGLAEILATVGSSTHMMIDLKCMTRRAARTIRNAIPASQPLTVSTRSWWVLPVFSDRASTELLRSCASSRQLHLARLLPAFGARTGFAVHERLLTHRRVKLLRTKADLLYSWGLTDVRRGEQLVEAGVTGLIVDDLDLAWPRTG